jgi:hypothetical protein
MLSYGEVWLTRQHWTNGYCFARPALLRWGDPRQDRDRFGAVASIAVWLVGLLVIGLGVWEAAKGRAQHGLLYESDVAAVACLALAGLAFATIIADLATYQPLLFAVASPQTSRKLVEELESRMPDMFVTMPEGIVPEPNSWAEVRRKEDYVMPHLCQLVRIDGLRARIAVRVLLRLFALVSALGVMAYAASVLTAGRLIENFSSAAPGMAEHLNLTIGLFAALGFGGLEPAHNVPGYSFTLLSVFVMVTAIYFIVTDIATSHTTFRRDLQHCVNSFVIRASRL